MLKLVVEAYELSRREEVRFRPENRLSGSMERVRSEGEGEVGVLAEAQVVVLAEGDDVGEELGREGGDGRRFGGSVREGEEVHGVGERFEDGGAGGVGEGDVGGGECLDDRIEKLADLLKEGREGGLA